MSTVRLLGPRDVRALATALGVEPTKRLGQNFVHDANTIRRIVAAADVRADDCVLEVGPGLGSLTLGLAETGASVMAVEIDQRLAAALPATVEERAPHSSVTVIPGDAAQIDALPQHPTVLVANLPYNVAVPILLHVLARFESIESVLVMVQSEVAERVAAVPGSRVYGVPSVKAAWYGLWTLAGTVPRTVFWPEPHVNSSLLTLRRKDRVHRKDGPEARATVFRLVDAAFAARRKMLRRALSDWAGTPAQAEAALVAAGIDPMARAEQLALDDFVRLAASGRRAR